MNSDYLSSLFSLRDRVVLLTGASGGIGQALAFGLAQAGATVALNSRSQAKLAGIAQAIQEQGGAAHVFAADISAVGAAGALVDAVAAACGRVDILVNCAGTNQRMPITAMSPAIYDQIMATNLRSVYFLCQAVVPHMAAHHGGKIINIGSLTSTIGLADVSVYGMTKSALAQLTKTLAIELAEHHVQVNCLCPGFFATELTEALWNSPERRQWMLDRLPLKRAGKPEDLVGLAIYLASRASDYTTGQTMYVDGGFLAGSQW